MTEPEVERIARVYGNYRDDPDIQAQWRADNPGNRAIVQEREREMKRLLRAHGRWPLDGCTILEVGCGSGNVLASLRRWGARAGRLYGVDLLPERIAAARRRYPELQFQCANAEALDLEDGSVDLVLLFTVFSSILDKRMATNVAKEIERVLSGDGAVLWYDFRYDNPRNPHVRGVTQADIQRLFPDFRHDLRTMTVLPPLVRRLGRLAPLLYPLLVHIPPLRTHYLGLLSKGGADK